MKKEDISDALNMLNDDIIEETARMRSRKKRPGSRWGKWLAAAACLALAVYGGIRIFSGNPSVENTELPMLTVSQSVSSGMGFEGFMAYDISELVNGNPWKETDRLAVLPVYKNPISYDDHHRAGGGNEDEMRGFLVEIAEKLGLNTETLEITEKESEADGDLRPSEVKAEAEGIEITVDQFLCARVTFEPALPLPEEYNFRHDASYEDMYKTAQYLKKEYSGLLGMKKPEMNIYGGDYTIYLDQGYQIEFFEGAGNDTEQMINYNFNRYSFSCDEEGKLWILWIFRPDLSQKAGDYPIIEEERAKELLEAGNYITSVPYEMPGSEYVAKTELVYRTGNSEQYFMPYYRFYVELPEAVSMPDGGEGLKCYGAYYVPAVESKYISDMPLWDGSFN